MRSLSELDALVTEMHNLEVDATSLRKRATEIQAQADEVRNKILAELEQQGVSSFKGNVGTVSIAERFAVKMPTDPDLKDELAAYLRERGAFEALWTVNYASLNSWFKGEMEAAKDAGTYLDVPGLEPKSDKILQFRKGAS